MRSGAILFKQAGQKSWWTGPPQAEQASSACGLFCRLSRPQKQSYWTGRQPAPFFYCWPSPCWRSWF